ncbi:uncharacterized protein IL334_005293 [Kwoniella shivajii]|uniref:Sec20 C-terminal domain-containing protein n=1 Tax=Kwoniella shivajii TaxID=564305 RepID=A0ABZ1D2R7_9TREE|nr:hypothetical protein IL334_005293 [Kwoniella shivajii]
MSQLSSILSSLPRRINDLEVFQLTRLKQCLGPLELHRELVDEMRIDLENVRYNLDVLKEISYSLNSPQREDVISQIQEMESKYTSIKKQFRENILSSKKNIISRKSRVHELSEKMNSRYELDESRINNNGDDDVRTSDEKGKGKAMSAAEFGMGGDDELQTKTNEVTTALRRTTAIMQTELERSVLSVQMLESSTQTLISTSTLYSRYTSLLQTSGQLVKAIEKADFLDRIIIFAALGFFLLVIAFIIKRRVVDRTVGVVIGGVGKGVGWYLFGTGRLLKLAFRGKTKGDGVNDLEKTGISDNMEVIGRNNINQDSAVGGQTPDQEKQGTVIGIDIAPGASPVPPFDVSKAPRGKVEIILNDESERIKVEWVKDEL